MSFKWLSSLKSLSFTKQKTNKYKFVRSRKRFRTITWKYTKTIGPFASFIYLVNQSIGSGLFDIPGLIDEVGWIPVLLGNFMVCCVAVFCSLMILRAMTMIPKNKNFEQRIEYSAVIRYFMSNEKYRFVSFLYHLGNICNNICGILIISKIIDIFIIKMFGYTILFQVYPEIKITKCSDNLLNAIFDGFFYSSTGSYETVYIAGFTIGYIINALICIHWSSKGLEETIKYQYVVFMIFMSCFTYLSISSTVYLLSQDYIDPPITPISKLNIHNSIIMNTFNYDPDIVRRSQTFEALKKMKKDMHFCYKRENFQECLVDLRNTKMNSISKLNMLSDNTYIMNWMQMHKSHRIIYPIRTVIFDKTFIENKNHCPFFRIHGFKMEQVILRGSMFYLQFSRCFNGSTLKRRIQYEHNGINGMYKNEKGNKWKSDPNSLFPYKMFNEQKEENKQTNSDYSKEKNVEKQSTEHKQKDQKKQKKKKKKGRKFYFFLNVYYMIAKIEGIKNLCLGKTFANLIDTYGFVSNIPSWGNEITDDVNVSKAIWCSSIFSSIFYFLFGLIFCLNYSFRNVNTSVLYLFNIVAVAPKVITGSIAMRYDLMNLDICSDTSAFFLGCVLPFLVAWVFSCNLIFANTFNYISLICGLFCNFLSPAFAYISACESANYITKNPLRKYTIVNRKKTIITSGKDIRKALGNIIDHFEKEEPAYEYMNNKDSLSLDNGGTFEENRTTEIEEYDEELTGPKNFMDSNGESFEYNEHEKHQSAFEYLKKQAKDVNVSYEHGTEKGSNACFSTHNCGTHFKSILTNAPHHSKNDFTSSELVNQDSSVSFNLQDDENKNKEEIKEKKKKKKKGVLFSDEIKVSKEEFIGNPQTEKGKVVFMEEIEEERKKQKEEKKNKINKGVSFSDNFDTEVQIKGVSFSDNFDTEVQIGSNGKREETNNKKKGNVKKGIKFMDEIEEIDKKFASAKREIKNNQDIEINKPKNNSIIFVNAGKEKINELQRQTKFTSTNFHVDVGAYGDEELGENENEEELISSFESMNSFQNKNKKKESVNSILQNNSESSKGINKDVSFASTVQFNKNENGKGVNTNNDKKGVKKSLQFSNISEIHFEDDTEKENNKKGARAKKNVKETMRKAQTSCYNGLYRMDRDEEEEDEEYMVGGFAEDFRQPMSDSFINYDICDLKKMDHVVDEKPPTEVTEESIIKNRSFENHQNLFKRQRERLKSQYRCTIGKVAENSEHYNKLIRDLEHLKKSENIEESFFNQLNEQYAKEDGFVNNENDEIKDHIRKENASEHVNELPTNAETKECHNKCTKTDIDNNTPHQTKIQINNQFLSDVPDNEKELKENEEKKNNQKNKESPSPDYTKELQASSPLFVINEINEVGNMRCLSSKSENIMEEAEGKEVEEKSTIQSEMNQEKKKGRNILNITVKDSNNKEVYCAKEKDERTFEKQSSGSILKSNSSIESNKTRRKKKKHEISFVTPNVDNTNLKGSVSFRDHLLTDTKPISEMDHHSFLGNPKMNVVLTPGESYISLNDTNSDSNNNIVLLKNNIQTENDQYKLNVSPETKVENGLKQTQKYLKKSEEYALRVSNSEEISNIDQEKDKSFVRNRKKLKSSFCAKGDMIIGNTTEAINKNQIKEFRKKLSAEYNVEDYLIKYSIEESNQNVGNENAKSSIDNKMQIQLNFSQDVGTPMKPSATKGTTLELPVINKTRSCNILENQDKKIPIEKSISLTTYNCSRKKTFYKFKDFSEILKEMELEEHNEEDKATEEDVKTKREESIEEESEGKMNDFKTNKMKKTGSYEVLDRENILDENTGGTVSEVIQLKKESSKSNIACVNDATGKNEIEIDKAKQVECEKSDIMKRIEKIYSAIALKQRKLENREQESDPTNYNEENKNELDDEIIDEDYDSDTVDVSQFEIIENNAPVKYYYNVFHKSRLLDSKKFEHFYLGDISIEDGTNMDHMRSVFLFGNPLERPEKEHSIEVTSGTESDENSQRINHVHRTSLLKQCHSRRGIISADSLNGNNGKSHFYGDTELSSGEFFEHMNSPTMQKGKASDVSLYEKKPKTCLKNRSSINEKGKTSLEENHTSANKCKSKSVKIASFANSELMNNKSSNELENESDTNIRKYSTSSSDKIDILKIRIRVYPDILQRYHVETTYVLLGCLTIISFVGMISDIIYG